MSQHFKHLNDKQLIEAFKKGDSEAFGILIVRYSPNLTAILLKKFADVLLVEEVLQEAFLRAMVAIKCNKYTEKGNFFAWVKNIASNFAVDQHRFKKRYPTKLVASLSSAIVHDNYENNEEDDNVFDFYLAAEVTAEEAIIKKESEAQVRKLFKFLPKDQKEVVSLRYFKKLSFREIGYETGVSVNTALGRMRYALINLRKKIKELDEYEQKKLNKAV